MSPEPTRYCTADGYEVFAGCAAPTTFYWPAGGPSGPMKAKQLFPILRKLVGDTGVEPVKKPVPVVKLFSY
jgi:hypothetical protein